MILMICEVLEPLFCLILGLFPLQRNICKLGITCSASNEQHLLCEPHSLPLLPSSDSQSHPEVPPKTNKTHPGHRQLSRC